jgi:hypothetical protein
MERHIAPTIIGEHPLARDSQGNLVSRIATVFPYADTIVTLPGIHATQRVAFVEILNRQRTSQGLPPLSEYEQNLHWENSVDLIMDEDCVLIRPDPTKMDIAFEADELLQGILPKHKIYFLHVLNAEVRQAIKRRGECWRISRLPKSTAYMKQMVVTSLIGIGGEPIYYYNKATGTRFLTCGQFGSLIELDEAQLRIHLAEIQDFARRRNRMQHPEIAFFKAGVGFTAATFDGLDFYCLSSDELIDTFKRLHQKFRDAVAPEYQQDDVDNPDWRREMFTCLATQSDRSCSEEELLGMSSEFYMQIEWLPGGRIEAGELIFDTVFEDAQAPDADPALKYLCDDKAKGFIFNFIREHGDLEYVNIGRVPRSLSRRLLATGRRDVYIAEICLKGETKEVVRIIRMVKWGIREHLEEGKDLLQAIIESEEYTEYILDRRLGCRQLGMNLPARIVARKISEPYSGCRSELRGVSIWTTYIERDYIHGIATDKMPNGKFQNSEFAVRFARLLGEAAASNLIVGRTDLENRVVFDDGDEVIRCDERGLPVECIVADPTATFTDYLTPLETLVRDYARPVNARIGMVPDPIAFAAAYIESFSNSFRRIQQEYRKRKRGFDNLFRHRRRDERGSFAYRWELILTRLNRAEAQELVNILSREISFRPQGTSMPAIKTVAG